MGLTASQDMVQLDTKGWFRRSEGQKDMVRRVTGARFRRSQGHRSEGQR